MVAAFFVSLQLGLICDAAAAEPRASAAFGMQHDCEAAGQNEQVPPQGDDSCLRFCQSALPSIEAPLVHPVLPGMIAVAQPMAALAGFAPPPDDPPPRTIEHADL